MTFHNFFQNTYKCIYAMCTNTIWYIFTNNFNWQQTDVTVYIARCIFTNNLWFRYLQMVQQNMIFNIHWVIDDSHYIPVASASSSVTRGSTFFRYEMHFSGVILCRQNVRIPITRLFLLRGWYWKSSRCFSSCHTISKIRKKATAFINFSPKTPYNNKYLGQHRLW